MKIHELKTWTEPFEAVLSGVKTAEYRLNDRDFQVGDKLILKEYYFPSRTYTGRSVEVEVTHIIHSGFFGVPEGYCVMSIEVVK